ncbi:MAG TPA: hypothetical protein VGK10_05125 [Prolixibacteraceae bacterium]
MKLYHWQNSCGGLSILRSLSTPQYAWFYIVPAFPILQIHSVLLSSLVKILRQHFRNPQIGFSNTPLSTITNQ